MADVRPGYTPDHAEQAALLRSRAIGDEMLRQAEQVRFQAINSAPADTGEYRRSFRSTQALVPTLSRTGGVSMRAGAVVSNSAPYAAAVEARHHTLARAVGRKGAT